MFEREKDTLKREDSRSVNLSSGLRSDSKMTYVTKGEAKIDVMLEE